MSVYLQISQKEQEIKDWEALPIAQKNFIDKNTRDRLLIRRNELIRWHFLQKEVSDLLVLISSSFASLTKSERENISQRVLRYYKRLYKLENHFLLTPPLDHGSAFLYILSQDDSKSAVRWGQRLLRMYALWAKKNRFQVLPIGRIEPNQNSLIVRDFQGNETSSLLSIRGQDIFGYLKGEAGQHLFFQGDERIYASVYVLPDLETTAGKYLKDLYWENSRISMDEILYNSTSTSSYRPSREKAIQLTHEPSGFFVQCEEPRSDKEGRQIALRVLRGYLEISGKKPKRLFIRSYRMEEQGFVQDHRTGQIFADTMNILDGKIERFLHAYLQRPLSLLRVNEPTKTFHKNIDT